ncbi:MAG: V-type ATPase subunit [Candidatus Hydrogenedentes bacterium]|nr:V-type ATPase subunit [Candidatus Hydrogenedentota bacterium]
MTTLTKSLNKWGFACGRVSVLEGRLTPFEFFESLAGLEKAEDLFHRLQDTSLREHMVPGTLSWEDWSTILDSYVHDQIVSLRSNSPEPGIADIFTLSDDYLNLKRALQNRVGYPFKTNLFTEARLTEVAAGSIQLLPDIIRPAIATLALLSNSDPESQMQIDIVLDGAYLRHYWYLVSDLKVPLISDWVKCRVMGKVLLILWRAARMGHSLKLYQQHLLPIADLDGLITDLCANPDVRTWGTIIPGDLSDLWEQALEAEEEEQVSTFELLCANYLTALAQRTKLQTAGPERLAGYLWGLWVEVFNLKLLISGKLNKLDADLLKRRIRNTYV